VAWGQLGDRPVLATGGADGKVQLWDPEQGTELRTLTGHPRGVRAVAWGQLDGRPVLASGGDDGKVRLWDPEQGTELRTLTGHPGGVSVLAWGQLGDRPVLASGGYDPPMLASDDRTGYGKVRLWDPEQGTELRALTGHPSSVGAVASRWPDVYRYSWSNRASCCLA
jgi:WD40 repeat protein